MEDPQPTKPLAHVVDDDENFRFSLERLVQREGFATASAGSLAALRELLKAQTPDVLLVDLELPDGNGWSSRARSASCWRPPR
jgi:DNA-binding response OmpR family regulator